MKELEIKNTTYDTAPQKQKPLSGEAMMVLKNYEAAIAVPHVVDLGPATKLPPRYEGDESPLALREFSVEYPESLNKAYEIVCEEHDNALMQLVEGHKEWETDYQFASSSLAFQVDGPAFPEEFLNYAANINPKVLAEFLHGRIYEVENNIAGYDLNGRLWPNGTTDETWHRMLNEVRQRTGRKVAVLASTEDKQKAMLLSELGLTSKDNLPSEAEIRAITGFDAFWGPQELIEQFMTQRGINSDYVFFGRTSRATSWLRYPTQPVNEPFLADAQLRRYVRAFALTHNFDNPALSLADPRVITDTKAALCMIGAAHLVASPEDIYSEEFLAFLSKKNIDIIKVVFEDELTPEKIKKLGKNLDKFVFHHSRREMLSPQLLTHFEARGIDPTVILLRTNVRKVRAKPLRRHYGAWGHIGGTLNSTSFINDLMRESQIRGPFALQPELQNYQVTDRNTGIEYLVIDRVFFVRGNDGRLKRMEGIRAHMPKNSPEGQKNSVHDGKYTLDAPLVVDSKTSGVIFDHYVE